MYLCQVATGLLQSRQDSKGGGMFCKLAKQPSRGRENCERRRAIICDRVPDRQQSMEKIFIKNRNNQKVCVLLDIAENQKGLVFVMHGLGGFKEQAHIQAFANAFKERDFTVVRFDTTNTLGESDGNYEDATLTNYYFDLEDVIAWGSKQPWYQEPFYLIGHSLGGFSVALYAERYPGKVKGVAPISPVVSGQLSEDAHKEFDAENYKKWQETGWLIQESSSKPGVLKKLKWSHMIDRLQYTLLPDAQLLTMPVLLITGEKDTSTPPKHVEVLLQALPGNRKLHFVIPGAPHTFKSPQDLSEIKQLIVNWITSIESA